MIDINKLRRLAQAATPGPDGVSLNWLKLLKDFQEEANPSVICELIDRLEMAEKERDNANQRYSSAVRLLAGIHALLYPPRLAGHDGRTWRMGYQFDY